MVIKYYILIIAKAGTPAVVKHNTESNENHSQSIEQHMVTARQHFASTLLTGPVVVVGLCRSLLCCGRCIIGNSKAGEGRGGGMTGVMTSSGSLVTCDTNAWKWMTVHIVIYCLFLNILLATLQTGWVELLKQWLWTNCWIRIFPNCIVFPVLIDSWDA